MEDRSQPGTGQAAAGGYKGSSKTIGIIPAAVTPEDSADLKRPPRHMPREPGVWQRICSISFNSPWQKVPRYHGDGLSGDKHRTWVWVVCILRKLAGLHPSTLPPPSGARISLQSGLLPPPGLAHLRATRRHFPNWFPVRQGRVGDGDAGLLPLPAP